MRYLTGIELKIYLDSAMLGQAKSCTVALQADSHESASADTGRARTYLAGRTDWELVVSKLVLSMRQEHMRIGKTYQAELRTGDTDRLRGTVICTQVQAVVSEGNLVQCSVRFRGTGPLQ